MEKLIKDKMVLNIEKAYSLHIKMDNEIYSSKLDHGIMTKVSIEIMYSRLKHESLSKIKQEIKKKILWES